MFRDGRVVEIGSGHRPWPQSHVLVDKTLEDSERTGSIQTGGRPLIIADMDDLPFRDGAFPFSIASHVLEHASDYERALAELTRVSRAGYIETPSPLFEFIEPHREYHNWIVSRQGAGLGFQRKEKGDLYKHTLLRRLSERNFAFKLFSAANPALKKTVLHWRDEIAHRRMADDPFHPDLFLDRASQNALQFGWELARLSAERARKGLATVLGRWRPGYPIEPLIRCSRCHGPLRIESTLVRCAACSGHYPREGDVYFLASERFTADTSAD